jgi:four helix bundle protein
MGTFKDLEVWKNSRALVKEVYKQTITFPKDEIYGLTSQIRRAVVSIPVNISEGSARYFPREFHYFLRISFGSLAELETLLLLAIDLEYLKEENYIPIYSQIKLITSQLSGLMHSVNKSIGINKNG